MKDRELYEIFQAASEKIIIDEKRKEESLSYLRKAILCKKSGISRSRKQILWNQMRYMDKSVLIIHLSICTVMLSLLVIMDIYGTEEKMIILFSTVLSVVLGIVSILEISRIFFSGIAELSESCYFNVKQTVALHMILSGMINLIILSVGILFVGLRWKINFLQIGLYILVPLVFTECCCLRVLVSEVGRKNSYLLIMVGSFLVVFYMILTSFPDWYKLTALGLWGVFLITGMMLLGLQIRHLFQRLEKGEIICMN